MIAENLQTVEKKIRQACEKAGRDRSEVTLVAVSKTKPIPDLEEAYKEGIRIFGENKVQELTDKYEQMPEDIQWHMIGHLQRNKVKYLIGKTELIHSVDSLRLAEMIETEAEKKQCVVKILIEVNVAEEDSKFGVHTGEVLPLIQKISTFSHIKICGLMTIAPNVKNPEENRLYFAKLRKLLVDIKGKNIDNINMDILSMGMTNDYEVAIEEGATMVRVGTGIFGVREYI